MAEAKPVVLLEGRVFHGRYEVVRCLRAGGMGAVYEVVDRKSRRRRALKVMLPSAVTDADLRARFKLEATITAEIESAHLVETLDADIDAETETPFVVMELLKGEDLGAMLARRGTLPKNEVIGLLHQVALALDRTHAASIVHRDLKPENLFVTTDDDGSARIKVLDFGIAKIVAGSAGPFHTTRAMGTPLYMPPEQIRGDGDIGPRADIYALGHVAYTLLAGEPYWTAEGSAATALYAIFKRILAGPSEPSTARAQRRSGVTLPKAFDGWFAKATALEPEDRFASASSLVAALASALGQALPRRFQIASEPAAPSGEIPPRAPASARLESARTTAATAANAQGSPGRSMLPWLAGAVLLAGGTFALSRSGSAPASAGGGDLGAMTAAPASAPVAISEPATSLAVVPVPPETNTPPARSSDAPIVAPVSARPTRGGAPKRGAPVPPPAPAAKSRSSGYDPTDVR